MTTVYLIRHAEAEGNLYRRCHGHYDSTITERGYRQIAALAKRFEGVRVDAAYSSDLVRTQTTALAITRPRGLALHTTPELREVGVGEWEDRTWAWLARFDRERLVTFNTDTQRWHVPGGQDMADVRDRMLAALRAIVAAHPGETVAIFSHGMALRALVGTLQELTLTEIDKTGHAENTAVTKLEADGDGIRVVYRDDASHLSDELTTLRRQAWTKAEGGIEEGVWFAPDPNAAGRFNAMREDECIGAVAVDRGEDGAALIREFRLDETARGQGLGIRLVGQAISCARTLGCEEIGTVVPRDDGIALKCAVKYGFSPVRATPAAVEYRLYIGKDEGYRTARFDEAWKNVQNAP